MRNYLLFSMLLLSILITGCGGVEDGDHPIARTSIYVYGYPEPGHMVVLGSDTSVGFDYLVWDYEFPIPSQDTHILEGRFSTRFVPDVPGIYKVRLFAINENGMFDMKEVVIDVKPECTYEPDNC